MSRHDELMSAVGALGVTPDEVRRGAENFKAPYLRQIAELKAALRNLVADVDDYERVNNLAPSPGHLHSWQSMRVAKDVLERT